MLLAACTHRDDLIKHFETFGNSASEEKCMLETEHMLMCRQASACVMQGPPRTERVAVHGDDDAPAGGTRLPPSPPPSPGLPGTLDGQSQLCSALGRWELHITKSNLAWYLVQRAVRLQKVTRASHTAATTHMEVIHQVMRADALVDGAASQGIGASSC